ncbi:ATP-binding cassette domain-containing protein [Rodentibacter haemolyticus]|uniref:ATP-binding cassette domain-containing protein n=1 Tax=Rodentibacter haemolyticus TaxID=2778911 RepID=UPI001E5A6BDE|nr:ATP-binding cassette domain-containing protein [Rodentibacter haemolyticus]
MSGGENQRLKLASELCKKGNIYILDEPSTGLHYQDIATLTALLQKMVQQGNSVIIIEHRPELIAQADWVIEMGEQGGLLGGEVVFEGRPKEMLKSNRTIMAKYIQAN